jgi:hypothetical protein
VTGDSMGGALTITFAYLSYLSYTRSLWDKLYFRPFAAPYCCNYTAFETLEQLWVAHDRYIEVINTDDFVNVENLLRSDKLKIRNALRAGTASVVLWIIQGYWQEVLSAGYDSEALFQRALRIAQLHPEHSLSTFVNGVNQTQSNHKLNHRRYVVYCQRNSGRWINEYVGRAHSNYMELNFNTVWSPLRAYEDQVYRYYAEFGFTAENNQLCLVGMFAKRDETACRAFLKEIIAM